MSVYGVFVQPQQTKIVKTFLEHHHILNLSRKIGPANDGYGNMLLFTSILASEVCRDNRALTTKEVPELSQLASELKLDSPLPVVVSEELDEQDDDTDLNEVQRALRKSLNAVIGSLSSFISANEQTLLSSSPKLYALYQPMLLFGVGSFDKHCWAELLRRLGTNADERQRFFSTIAAAMKVSHIATNAPISAALSDTDTDVKTDNLIRSPVGINPLYGDFGPQLPPFPIHNPTSSDFNEAFWVSTRQNGVKQVWAPRYTMFSSGNVTEKARVLTMPSVKQAVAQGLEEGTGSAAVDLFAGIGYFAFSYAKAGISQILCWDLNPWSIEGLKRGAAANRWSYEDLTRPSSHYGAQLTDAKLLLFCETNEHALERVASTRSLLPPIRHVNCGMLPTAAASWKTALAIIDPAHGGWIHLHESMKRKDASTCSTYYVDLLQQHLDILRARSSAVSRVELVATTRVKSMGPRLYHHVLDFWIPAVRTAAPQAYDNR